jgi:hypothetical protein
MQGRGDDGGDAWEALMTQPDEVTTIELAKAAIRALAWTYRYWLQVGRGFAAGRAHAIRMAETDDVHAQSYRTEFSRWLTGYPNFQEIGESTRDDLFWLVDNRDAIERWRKTLSRADRLSLNHPSVIRGRYDEDVRLRSGEAGGRTADR